MYVSAAQASVRSLSYRLETSDKQWDNLTQVDPAEFEINKTSKILSKLTELWTKQAI